MIGREYIIFAGTQLDACTYISPFLELQFATETLEEMADTLLFNLDEVVNQ